jgi:polar amino acid transport system substrate-binding protein
MRLTRVLLLVFAAVVGWSAIAAQSPTALSLVSTPWPPFTNPPGQARFALDLVEAALGRANLPSHTTIVAPEQFTPALLQERFDGSAAAWKDPERERVLVFSQPYLENRLVLVGRHGADVSARTMADLHGRRVAIVDGYSYGPASELAGPVFVKLHTEEDCVARLLKGSVDYTLMDELVLEFIVENFPDKAATRLQIGTTPLVRRDLFLAVRRSRPDAESIVSRFNAQLRNMVADRTYHRLLHVDWIRADVNGDGRPAYIPSSDNAGPVAPAHAYTLFAQPEPENDSTGKPGFYFGGTLYSDWASVPDSYKVGSSSVPDPRRASASIFTFRW